MWLWKEWVCGAGANNDWNHVPPNSPDASGAGAACCCAGKCWCRARLFAAARFFLARRPPPIVLPSCRGRTRVLCSHA